MKRKCLAVGIILLFVGTCIIPAIAQDTEKPLPTSRGHWLYVGGSGLGNYTKIQDAINASTDGDTVFVYDDSSPYYENLQIYKNISLIGEDKNTTIIDGNENKWETICINSGLFGVTVKEFTIIGGWLSGISIYVSSFCIIENNIINSNDNGILLVGTNCIYTIVRNNNISNNNIGVSIDANSNYNNISYNYISNNLFAGINTGLSCSYNNISYNHISNSQYGIRVCNVFKKYNELNISNDRLTKYTNIISNNISFNDIGVYFYTFGKNRILKNNFIFNDKNAYFELCRGNIWNGNYWNKTRFLPYPIYGKIPLILLNLFLSNIFGIYVPNIMWVNFDWHPAKEPYDIGGK